MQKDNVQRNYSGINQDSSLNDQPKDTYRFALNTVNETIEGDSGFLSNEESNELLLNIPKGFYIIGKEYCGKDSVILFLVNNSGVSEIGIMNSSGKYETYMNDSDSDLDMKLGFSLDREIKAVYRLRLGCERTVYFTDNYSPPRYFNFDKPETFKSRGKWNARKFSLQKTYSRIPIFDSVKALDSGGTLKPGSYNFAVQYLDENLNPTEWITTSPTVKIYNDVSSLEYAEISGSISSDVDYLDFPPTSKAIEISLSSLDTDFVYYRLAIIEATNGSGEVSSVKYSETIPTSKRTYIYSGTNAVSIGTKEEIIQMTGIIGRAGTIEQIENRLILGNTTGKQINFCNLQKYASQITAKCITKKVNLTSLLDPSNTKNPIYEFGGIGYMPGEIYSFGVIYIFADGSLSPVYHIPGRSDKTVPTPTEPNTYLMSNKDNMCNSTFYDSTNSCGSTGLWGVDSDGIPLQGKNVRHHRFPLRSEIGLPLITDKKGEEQTSTFYSVELNIKGKLKTPVTCPEDLEEGEECVETKMYPFDIRVNYKVDNEAFFFVESIDPNLYADGENPTYDIDVFQYSQYHGSSNITDITVEVTDASENYKPSDTFNWSLYFEGTPEVITKPLPYESRVQGRSYETEILGIKFEGVQIPSIKDTNGEEVVGYYIVRNERTEYDKTILDSGVLTPSVMYNKYISHSLLNPQTDKLSPTVFGLIHPEHKFNNREYVSYDELIQEGNFKVTDTKLGKINYDDVYDGTSYDSKGHKEGNDDGHAKDGSPASRGLDGWSLNVITRDNIVSYENTPSKVLGNDKIANKFYLDALGSRSINDNLNDVYNLSSDNKIGFIELEKGQTLPSQYKLPYVIMKRHASDPYSNFRVLPYYKETLNPVYFNTAGSDTVSVFNGDSYVSPMRYCTSTFWDNKVAKRKGKGGILKVVLGAFIAILGATLLAVTGGSSSLLIGAGVAIMGAGALIASSGLKVENANKVYSQEYDKGLRQTALDSWVDSFYNYRTDIPFGYQGNGRQGYDGPSDDTIQWIGESLTDLWFESSINTSLRNHFATGSSSTYLNSPGRIESGNDSKIGTWEFFSLYYTDSNAQRYPVSKLETHMSNKLLAFDAERDDNRYYLGIALGEYYHVNPDFMRKNKEKVYFHLPLEYDCCSECQEVFPHRIHYSEQSFQEELSDNYRVFLPNNYRDIQGETGPIMNIFKMGNNLFIHTTEALWNMPRNYQERVTDQIVSFIGTGSYFEIPPQKVMDSDNGQSAGTQHKLAGVKTPIGYIFPSARQAKIYLFDGKSLKAISDMGLSRWFKQNIPMVYDSTFESIQEFSYPYKDNPVNPQGTGFILAYDTDKERVLITKIDYLAEVTPDTIKRGNKIGWTLSYSLKHNTWTSWHSYIPNVYLSTTNNMYSFLSGEQGIWKHGVKGSYLSFYGKKVEQVMEYVSLSSPLITKIWNHMSWQTMASKYIKEEDEFVEDRFTTFNKLVAYNSRQTTGEISLVNRDTPELQEDYYSTQTVNLNDNTFLIAKKEKDWFLNDLRDIRINYDRPIWKSDRKTLSALPMYTDKILNTDTLDPLKDWTELESFRDKFLVVRLIFSGKDNVKLTTNYTIENEQQSFK